MTRDRTGELLEDVHDDVSVHSCVDGWTAHDDDGRPFPCPSCRPHLVRRAGVLTASRVAGELTERQWQQRVVDLAQLRGWRHFHAYSSRRSPAGWPDLALVRTGRLVLAELKTERGRVRPEQHVWLEQLATVAGVEVHLWRPSDWPQVQQVLR